MCTGMTSPAETNGHRGIRRRRSVAVVGGGFAGVGAAVMLGRAGYHDVTVFERGQRVGGVWNHNTYPGAACDVPSHLYEFSFEPNPHWSRRFAPQAEIQAYIEDVARRYEVLDKVRTGTEVTRARWDEERSVWLLTTSRGDHEADVLITACGQLSVAKMPSIPGLESFEGPAFHTSQWRHDVDLTGKRVAVVGTGCSAIQAVPAIQPIVEQLDIYQRSPGWTMSKMDFAYGDRVRRLFERFPIARRLDRLAIFAFMEYVALGMTGPRWTLAPLRAMGRRQINNAISDPVLRAAVTPGDELGCKRLMLTDEWYPTLTRPNVELISDQIDAITAGGVRVKNGTERAADVLVLATGFKTHGFVAPMEIIGRSGRTLARGVGEGPPRLSGNEHPRFPEYVPALRAEHERRERLCDLHDRGWGQPRHRSAGRARTHARRKYRGPPADRRGVRPRAACGAGQQRLAYRLHELVRR